MTAHAGGSSSRHVDALFRFAQAQARRGRRTDARRLLWAALRLAPNRADLWIWLAGVSRSPHACLGYLARALTLDPRNPKARAGLRWARRQAAGALPPPVPHARPLVAARPASKLQTWHWATGAAFLSMLIVSLTALALLPNLAAMAALEPEQLPASRLAALPPPTSQPLPTTTKSVPPTWTPTATHTPSPTASPTPTVTPSPTETPTPLYPSPTWVPTSLPTPISPGSGGERWIDVDLSEQLLIAYEGDTPVRWVAVSTGLPATPTIVGQFRIYVKYQSTYMSGDDYDLPNVPYTMYFYKGYGLHGTYWHSNFGRPMSHGCVNLPTPEAEWLFAFASVGTLVNVHY